MPTPHMGGDVPKRLVKPDMLEIPEKAGWPMERLDMLEKAGRPMEIKFFWPGERLSFFPRSGISASGPPASSAGCPAIEGTRCSFFPKNGGAFGAWLFDLVGQVSHGLCQVAHALDVGQVSRGLCQVAHVLDVGQVAHGLCLGCSA